MSAVEGETAPTPAAFGLSRARPRRLRAVLLAALTAQYTIVAIVVGLSVAGTLRYLVTPQIVATFEAISAALKR